MSTKTAPATKIQAGKSLADFRSAHDKTFFVPEKIKAALKLLGDGWEYDIEFSRLSGVSCSDLNRFAADFDEHTLVVTVQGKSKRVWAGTPAFANSLREMVS